MITYAADDVRLLLQAFRKMEESAKAANLLNIILSESRNRVDYVRLGSVVSVPFTGTELPHGQ